jgi:hypothetical protein
MDEEVKDVFRQIDWDIKLQQQESKIFNQAFIFSKKTFKAFC